MDRLKPFIHEQIIRRSLLEVALSAIQLPAAEARAEIERLLAEAGVTIEEDSAEEEATELASGADALLDVIELDAPEDLPPVNQDAAVVTALTEIPH